MNFANGLVVFFITWWVAIFMVLPFGVRHPAVQDKGIMAGTPMQPNMKRVVFRTTILATIIWLIIYALVSTDVISFSRVANEHALEDKL